jgi:hypothetical protein
VCVCMCVCVCVCVCPCVLLEQEFKQLFPYNKGAIRDNTEFNFFVDKGCKFEKLEAAAGSMVIWDKRLVHGLAPAAFLTEDGLLQTKYVRPERSKFSACTLYVWCLVNTVNGRAYNTQTSSSGYRFL